MEITADLIRAESPAILVLLAAALVHLGEQRVHKYNYAYLTTVDGEELIPTLMKQYYRLVASFPVIAFLSGFLLPRGMQLLVASLPGIALIIIGFILRVWSMRTLGRLWSKRCIYIPDMPRAGNGPFQYLKHPEYYARTLESWGFVLFFGLNPIALLLWLRLILLSARIMKVESRQLIELSAAPLHLEDGSSTVGASKL